MKSEEKKAINFPASRWMLAKLGDVSPWKWVFPPSSWELFGITSEKNSRRDLMKRFFVFEMEKILLRTELSDGKRSTHSPATAPNTHPMTIPTGPWSNWWVKLPVENTMPQRTPNKNIATTSFRASIDRITVWIPLLRPKPKRHSLCREAKGDAGNGCKMRF